MKVFIPIKRNSQRVPNKNFRMFNDVPLWEYVVDKLREFEVYIDTDSSIILDKCKSKPWVKAFRRRKHLIGDTVSVIDLIKDFIVRYSINDIICQVHVTSPFLLPEHIKFAYGKISKEGYDSVFSADVIQSRFWRQETYGWCPVNHNPMKLEQTQDLPKYYMENSYMYMFHPNVVDFNNRIGYNPYVMEIGFPYNIDIDTEEDWKLVNVI